MGEGGEYCEFAAAMNETKNIHHPRLYNTFHQSKLFASYNIYIYIFWGIVFFFSPEKVRVNNTDPASVAFFVTQISTCKKNLMLQVVC